MTEFDPTSNFFTAFRQVYSFPYFYREQPLDWFRYVGMWGVGVAYITVVLAITVIIAFLGTRGYSRWRITLQMVISLAIGFTIILCATGIEWQETDYERNQDGDILKYKIHIGLSQANITMARMAPTSTTYDEYHNVKIGFIEVYQAQVEYRAALRSGWPVGILRIARYISADMDGMRYMRGFRWSGYAAKIVLWIAFTSWLLANVLIGSHVSYCAAFLLLTGALQLLACIVYDNQTPHDFYIPMDDGTGNKLRLRYAWMYWLTLFMAIFVILMAAIILVLDYLRPADMNKFFGTTSEFHSPFDEELTQNQNKDIKGMIRSLSQKRPRSDLKKQSGSNADAEKSRKTPFNLYSRTGADSTAMSSIHEGDEIEKRNRATEHGVPQIHVEMVDITCEREEASCSNAEYKETSDSETESIKEHEHDMTDSSIEVEETVRSRASDQHELADEN